jgi:hypothetical protein
MDKLNLNIIIKKFLIAKNRFLFLFDDFLDDLVLYLFYLIGILSILYILYELCFFLIILNTLLKKMLF